MYKIIALCGQAGAGKDTVMKQVLALNPNLHEIVSCTTRPPREGEKDGINYLFLTEEKFADKALNGEMLEMTCFNDWFYGTSYDSLRSDCVNIGVFNPDGIESLAMRPDIQMVVYLIEASDKIRLMRQLERETNPDVEEIIRRWKADREDFSDLNFHHNVVLNETPDDLLNATAVVSTGALRLDKSS